MRKNVDRRSYPVEMRTVTGEDGQRHIEGHAAVFNSLSEEIWGFREMILPGAFAGAIGRSDIRALWNHNPDVVLGRMRAGTLRAWEDEKGLAVDIVPPDTQVARDLITSIERGDVDQMSFSFIVGTDRWSTQDGVTLREILEVQELFDVSPVTFPAYPETDVSARTEAAFKEFRSRSQAPAADPQAPASESRKAVPSHETPMADEGREWDADGAEKRLRTWASSDGSGDKETMDWEKYRTGFTWYDSEAVEDFGSYKMPHHDIVDGEMVVVWRGVSAAMSVLMGGRGGVDIPEGDMAACHAHLAKHYMQFEKEPPERGQGTGGRGQVSDPAPGQDQDGEVIDQGAAGAGGPGGDGADCRDAGAAWRDAQQLEAEAEFEHMMFD